MPCTEAYKEHIMYTNGEPEVVDEVLRHYSKHVFH